MTDEPTAAPTRPTREQATQALLDATEAISAYINAGGADGCLDSANVIGIWSTDGRQARITQGDLRRIAEVRAALLAGEGTAQPDPSDGRWVVVNGGALAWRDRRTDRRWMLDPDEIGDQLWTAAPQATLTAAFTALVGLVRASRASGEGTAPQPDLDALMADVANYDAPASTAEDLDEIVAARERLAEAVPALVAEIRRHRGTAPQVPAEVVRELIEAHDAVEEGLVSFDLHNAAVTRLEAAWAAVRVVAADGAPQPEADDRG